jgi:hypothetical protein
VSRTALFFDPELHFLNVAVLLRRPCRSVAAPWVDGSARLKEIGMIRVLAILFFVLMGTEGFAQTRFDGKWTTAQRQNPELLGETERRQGDAQLELTLDAVNVKGALSLGGLGGQFYVFNEGKVDGMKLWFRTTATSGNRKANSTWHVKLVDDNTIVLWSWALTLSGTTSWS